METQLRFNIRGQTISRADRFIVVSGSVNYLRAKFSFLTPDWDGLAKVAIFSRDGVEPVQMYIGQDGVVLVPWTHIAEPGTFSVTVYGLGGDPQSPVLETATEAVCKVVQGAYTGETIEHEAIPELWEQLITAAGNMDGGTYDDWKEGE